MAEVCVAFTYHLSPANSGGACGHGHGQRESRSTHVGAAVQALDVTFTSSCCPQVLEEVLGNKALYVREGGSIPAMAMFKKHLGIETTVFGFGLDDDFVHAPNERWARRCCAVRYRRYSSKQPSYKRLHGTGHVVCSLESCITACHHLRCQC